MVPLDADEVEGAAHRVAPTLSEEDWQEVRDILGELSFCPDVPHTLFFGPAATILIPKPTVDHQV